MTFIYDMTAEHQYWFRASLCCQVTDQRSCKMSDGWGMQSLGSILNLRKGLFYALLCGVFVISDQSSIIVLSCSFTAQNHSKMELCHRGSHIQDRQWIRKAAVASSSRATVVPDYSTVKSYHLLSTFPLLDANCHVFGASRWSKTCKSWRTDLCPQIRYCFPTGRWG